MDNEDMQKILAASNQSEAVTILMGENSGDKDFLAAQSLKARLGEKATIVNAPEHLRTKWRFLFGYTEEVKKEVTLSLDVEKNPIEELRYEKEGGRLKIYLTPQYPLRAEDFAFEESYHPSDMVIALGFGSKDELRAKLREVPLKNPEALVMVGGNGPRSAPAEPQRTPKDPVSSDAMKLWARAYLRSSVDADSGIFWAFLPKDDFLKTGQTGDVLVSLLKNVRSIMNFPEIAVVLWQDPQLNEEKVKAIIHTENKQKINQLSSASGIAPSGDHIIAGTYPNFSEAEIELRKLLKKAL